MATRWITVKDDTGQRHRRKDIRGEKYGHLTPDVPLIINGEPAWRCLCDCGRQEDVLTHNLTRRGNMACSTCRGFARSYNTYKQNSKRDGYEFDITLPEFATVMDADECFYCGGYFVYAEHQLGTIDAEGSGMVGRVSGNCVAVCPDCRDAKGRKSHEEFVYWAHRIGELHG